MKRLIQCLIRLTTRPVLLRIPFQVFISYEADVAADWAVHLKRALEKRGVHSFLDKVDIPKGSLDFQQDIDNALNEVNVLILIWTSPGLSKKVIDELGKGLARFRKEGRPRVVLFMMVGLDRSYSYVNQALGIDTSKLQQENFEATKESLARGVILFLNTNSELIGGRTLSDRVEV